ncbi:hypothetical protein TWF506_009915 [Arthrobotrys conoides]|uniref:Uncharacterized protein n=1 Tax=Arthrobotrys conoides TaxID=74498 RepID=A0AAN8RSZ5_9PEZI
MAISSISSLSSNPNDSPNVDPPSPSSGPPPIPYPHPLESSAITALSYHDQCLRRFSVEIRNKPDWTTKIKDRRLMTKWIREAALQDNKSFSDDDYLVPVWDTGSIKYVTEELEAIGRYVEYLREEGFGFEPDMDCVWRGDGIVEEGVRRELVDAVATLENVPEDQKDWHPGSQRQVLDLVHPSLWPIIYGRTISGTDGKPIQCPKEATVPAEIDYDEEEEEDDYYDDDDDDEEEEEDEDEDEDEDAERPPKVERPRSPGYYQRKERKEQRLLKAQRLNGWSKKFCWLPSLFQVSRDGKSTKIKSYINNLSTPSQKELFYPIIEKIFTKFVPMFNHLLAELASDRHKVYRTWDPTEFCYEGKEYHVITIPTSTFKRKWEEFLGQYERGETLSKGFMHHRNRKQGYSSWRAQRNEDSDWGDNNDEEDDDDGENDEGFAHYGGSKSGNDRVKLDGKDNTNNHKGGKKEKKTSPYDYYEKAEIWDVGTVAHDSRWSQPRITSQIKLEGKAAKVIVKLANIVLTPENPRYYGGSWHVEAMKNERIIATGIYYYAQENITDSTLSFRRTARVDRDSEWNDSYWGKLHDMGHNYGIQNLGKIQTKENRAIVFPNVYQHCVSGFDLVDPTKPGYRKILVFFLCDPNHDVPTTETIMPQQPEQRIDLEKSLREGPLGKLPEEIFQGIVGELPPLISLEEAQTYRLQLMGERSSFTNDSSKVQGRYYNLCEH